MPYYGNSVCFCFIVKDGAKYLKQNLESIIEVAHCFKEYKVIYVENDSTDTTREILDHYAVTNEFFTGKQLNLDGKHSTELCNSGENYNCALRTNRLAYLRQLVLDTALAYESDVIVMLDMDFVFFDPRDFFRMFEEFTTRSYIDGIFGMSVLHSNSMIPYDIAAIRPYIKLGSILSGVRLVRVSSAFSGFGVYRTESIRKCKARYIAPKPDIEHVYFNRHFKHLYVFPSFRPVYVGTSRLPSICYFGNFHLYILVIVTIAVVIIIVLSLFVYSVTRKRKNKKI